jgi:hypothetical protein
MVTILVEKSLGRKLLGRQRKRYEDNVFEYVGLQNLLMRMDVVQGCVH